MIGMAADYRIRTPNSTWGEAGSPMLRQTPKLRRKLPKLPFALRIG
jgi:hypothetical protein